MRIVIATLAFAAGCSSPAGADRADPTPDPPRSAKLDSPSMVRLHMRGRFGDLVGAQHALLHGRIDDMRQYAYDMIEAPDELGTSPWATEIASVRAAAGDLAAAPSIDEGLHRVTRVATACARCHVATGSMPRFDVSPPAPDDRDDVTARMARHRWAGERLFEGMIGDSDGPWRAGLEVLAAAPLAWSDIDADKAALARQLQRTARTALDETGHDELEDRARAYGELLVTCAACHAKSR